LRVDFDAVVASECLAEEVSVLRKFGCVALGAD
jgi:hypothetical protein